MSDQYEMTSSIEKALTDAMTATDIKTMRAPYLVIDDFLPLEVAEGMRSDIDAHCGNPGQHQPDKHQVWNYWFVPGLYTYLRTLPEKIIERPRVDLFMDVMSSWSATALGLRQVTWPFLSMYVSGCRQNLHNDSVNGQFAFVYSLTRNDRRTSGGETIIMHEGDLFRRNVAVAQAGRGFFDSIEPRFNRLVVFDDRMPHGVERVDGSMDPAEGRFVLHGHLRADGPIIAGALTEQQVSAVIAGAWHGFVRSAAARVRLYHGPFVVRLAVSAAGAVDTCAVLMDRVTSIDATDVGWPILSDALVATIAALRFPEASGPSAVIQPLLVGDSLFRSSH